MPTSRILRERVAGQSAMSAVVYAQSGATPRGRFARILGLTPLTHESRASYRGALGELLVGDALENLGPSWDVLHDLPLTSAVLDHLLIGRAGVFSVRAASYGREDVTVGGDELIAGGESRDDIRCAAEQAAEVADLLAEAAGEPVYVRSLLVVVGPRRLAIKHPASGVRVIDSRELPAMLDGAPHTLTGDQVARISDLADLESTWPAVQRRELDTQQLHRDFNMIRAQVSEALGRRIFWAAAGTIVVYTAVCSVIAAFVSVLVAG
jgi:hypothetical protein